MELDMTDSPMKGTLSTESAAETQGKGMSDVEFEERVASWLRRFEGIVQGMNATPNEAGHYPKIDFGPLVASFQAIVTGMREGRAKDRSLILVPGSPRIITDRFS